MPVNLSVKDVPDALAARLRARARLNHRSLQGELMSILEAAVANPPAVPCETAAAAREAGNLMDRLLAIAGERGIDTTKRLARDQTHDRARLRKSGT